MEHESSPSAKPRLLIVGDSMTNGSQDDYTWRYRFWHWLKTQHVDVVFVGPYLGTQAAGKPLPPQPPSLYDEPDQVNNPQGTGGYARDIDADFDSHHFSVWGKQCAVAKDEIEDVLRAHPADIVLVMLGFNDVGWFVSDARGTLQSMKSFVDNAREVNSDVTLMLADIPQRTRMDGREDLPVKTTEYNKLLLHAIPGWTTKRSPIHLVELCQEYTAETATYDGLHPNALGDFQIAKAFSSAFVKHLHMGKQPLDIPKDVPARALSMPIAFKLMSSPQGVTATWNRVYGSQSYEVRRRVDHGDFDVDNVGFNRWDSHWATEGHMYEVQVRACYGNDRGDWTPLLSATARPRLAPPPEDVCVESSNGKVTVTWQAPKTTAQIVQYTVFWKDKDVDGIFPSLGAFKQSPAHLHDLEVGRRYDFWMNTWSEGGEGFFGPMQEVRIR